MWGFGFILTITKSKTILIILQQLAAITTIFFIDDYLKKSKWNDRSIIIFRVLVVIGFPWFFFHAVIWPYSWGANLLLIGVFSLFRYVNEHKFYWLIFSAGSLGLMLNFRSDYLYLVILFGFYLAYFIWLNKLSIKGILIWIGLIVLLMLPWS